MTYLGTRPILQDELQKYELHHRARIAIKPGITGMWQVSGRSDMGNPNDMNEMEFSCEVGKIISQLEIYDQVWVARDLKNAVRIEERIHSTKGIELTKKIINVLMEDEGCAECFPYDVVDELKAEFGI